MQAALDWPVRLVAAGTRAVNRAERQAQRAETTARGQLQLAEWKSRAPRPKALKIHKVWEADRNIFVVLSKVLR